VHPLQVNSRFGVECHLHLEGGRISEAENQHEAWLREVSCSSETSVYFNGLYGVISQKTYLFIATALRTTNPAKRGSVFEIAGLHGGGRGSKPKAGCL
jgi:hypothetical protein